MAGGGDGVRVLMVSPYPPLRDGIASYAVQEVRRLVGEGQDVEVLSPGPTAAHHHLDLHGPRGPLALARRVRAYDRLLVQFHPDVFYPVPATAGVHVATSLGLAACLRLAPSAEVRVHEVDYDLRPPSPTGTAFAAMWRSADRVTVHTDAERDAFAEAFGVPPERIAVARHGSHFVRRTELDRASARVRLGLPVEPFLFLSIGFVQPHKGFDRALRAYAGLAGAGLGPPATRLDVVGSVRVEEPEYVAHLDDLVALARATPGATVHPGFVSDELFDVWLVASDAVVLPYRRIWSSSVLERAALYDRPVIATRVGGLADQAPAGTVLVEDDAGLAAAMRAMAGAPVTPSGVAGPWAPAGVDRDTIQAEVRARATASRRGGGLGGTGAGRPSARSLVAGAGAGVAPAPLRRLPTLTPAPAVSARPGASALKRLVRRLTAWEIDPVVQHVNALQRAVAEALSTSDREPTGR
jgi:glycosyltransferase involved in cell wall biosynthesis